MKNNTDDSHLPGAFTQKLQLLIERTFSTTLIHYVQVFSGVGVRLCLTAVYFFILTDSLSLADMGVFASTSSAGMMAAAFSGCGFASLAFRSAAGKKSSLGLYLGIFYVAWLITIPILIFALSPIYLFLFKNSISYFTFTMIVFVEVGLWRIVEMLQQVNNGLGAYAKASMSIILASICRTIGALLFSYSIDRSVETWAYYYFIANAFAVVLVFFLYHPRVKLRFHFAIMLRKLKEGLFFAISYFAYIGQNEIDKLIMLTFSNETTAGIFAICSRLIDLTGAPIRSFYVLYSRKLIREGTPDKASLLKVEAAIAFTSTMIYLSLIGVLYFYPLILGRNIHAAFELLVLLGAVPAFKNLMEFHAELFFAIRQMGVRAIIANIFVVLKAVAMAGLLCLFPASLDWGVWMNLIYAALYILSLSSIFYVAFRKRPKASFSRALLEEENASN